MDDQQPTVFVVDDDRAVRDSLELRDRLESLGSALPMVFITGRDDLPVAPRAMQGRAVDFVEKPLREREVLGLVVQGGADKVITSRLGLSRRSVEIHRAHLMCTMEVGFPAEPDPMVMTARG